MVALCLELTDPPPQSPFDDFNSRSDACLGIWVLSFKSDGLIEILGIEEGGATFNAIAIFAKESARHQQFCAGGREVGTMSLAKLLALRIHAGMVVSYDQVLHAFSSVNFSSLNASAATSWH
jgi:hypothetical protein